MSRKPNTEFDFSAVPVKDATLPPRHGAANPADNPFVALLKDSRDNKTGKSITVPEKAADRATYLIRAASKVLNCGSRVVASKPVKGQVTIEFEASKRRQHKPKDGQPVDDATQPVDDATQPLDDAAQPESQPDTSL